MTNDILCKRCNDLAVAYLNQIALCSSCYKLWKTGNLTYGNLDKLKDDLK